MALGTMAAAASTACEEGEDVGEVHALRHVLDLRTDVRQGAGELALERRLHQPDAVLVRLGSGFSCTSIVCGPASSVVSTNHG